VGNVDSIGNVIFLAGQERYACPHTTFMFHGVAFNFFNQTVKLEGKNTRETLDNILSLHSRMGSIIKERTKLEAAQIILNCFERLRRKTPILP
jgi:ATP-dependent protease ClpP protease subunit